MKHVRAGLIALGLFGLVSSAALADEATGEIAQINVDTATITMTDGTTYTFPVDFFVDDIKPGQKVRVFYDVEGGQRKLYDLQIES
ncbi:DUF1344 domain-containing protein [Pannonibacter sp. Q-1]|jgi:hypothetical protein|uniref:DUF1344 domain-containing protein n=2 Tax=Pannonibacter TaxID=227873 RepID=A0A0U2W047_9HYPH|nr:MULTISPECIES: DUF1344 domain-containing protein [Pannonibacter]ALV25946.1 hypothetical protein APZ00_01670 [Pannonibacter phragmitetus]MBA4206545.1 DUF1344 domain-containing protein [Polymorphum sp.]CUA94566.1 Protein of unknown function (DUF1344) [Pannonibacter indicus]